MTAMVALFGFTLRQIFGQRKLWLAVALLLLPAAITVLIWAVGGEQTLKHRWEAYHVLMQMLIGLLVPLVCMLYGNALLGAEIEQRTIVYLLTRRLHRATVLLVRFAAVWLALTVLCELALLAAHLCATMSSEAVASPASGGSWQPWVAWRVYAGVTALGVAGYLAVFTTISVVFARSLIVSVVYFVLFELIIANLPLTASAASITHHLRQTVMDRMPEVRGLYDWPREVLEQVFPVGETGIDNLLLAVAVLLGLASVLVTFRELVPARVSRD